MRSASFLLVVSLLACRPNTSLPHEARVTCEENGDCPEGWTCRAKVGACVEDTNDDTTGPKLREVELTPGQATLGGFIDVSFLTDEELGLDPEVTLADDQPFFVDPDAAHERERHVLRYVVTAATPEGEVSVNARVVDRYGNETVSGLGTVTIDFSPPDVTGLGWTLPPGKTHVTVDDVVVLTGAVEESATLVGATLLRSSTTSTADLSPSVSLGAPSGGSRSLSVSLDTGELTLVDDEELRVELVFVDGAGNENPAGSVRSPALPVDVTEPSDVALLYEGNNPTQTRDLVVTLTSAGGVQARLSGDIVSSSAWQTLAFPAQLLVTLSDGEGQKTVHAEVRDGAFNTVSAAPLVLDYVANFDTEGPSVLSVTAQDTRLVRVVFDEVVTIASAEDAANYTVSLGPEPLAVLGATLEAGEQSVLLFFDADMVGQGAYELTVSDIRDTLFQVLEPNPSTAAFAGFGNAPDPSAPTIVEPASDVALVDLTPTLRFTAREGADAYRVEVSTSADFSAPVRTADLAADETSYTVSPALTDGTYYWRVRSDIAPLAWAEGTFELVDDAVYVRCQIAETCSDAVADRFGHRQKPFRTITRAVEFAAQHGLATVRVAGGESTYTELVTLRDGVSISGGYSGATWATGSATTTLVAPSGSAMAMMAVDISSATTVEKLTIRGGRGGFDYALYIVGSPGLLVRDNVLEMTSNSSSGTTETITVYINGSLSGSSPPAPFLGPVLRNNTIRGATRDSGTYADTSAYAVMAVYGSPWLDGNTILGPSVETTAVGVALRYFGMPVLTNNVIVGGAGRAYSTDCIGLDIRGDYHPYAFPVVVTNNTIHSGDCEPSIGSEAAVRLAYTDGDFINNLFVTQGTSGAAYCLYEHLDTTTEPDRIEKNGLINCVCGYRLTGTCPTNPQTSGAVTVWTGNTAGTSSMFTAMASDDFHLLSTAPSWARLLGRNTSTGTCSGTTCGNVMVDRDGEDRTCPNSSTACFSLGAYELD